MFSSTRTLFPYLHDKTSCTAILLTNLAQPQWIQISCETQYTISDVLCLTEAYNQLSVANMTNLKLYDKDCVIQNNTCYLFWWPYTLGKTLKILKTKSVFKGNVNKFEYLFMAVAAIFPPILDSNLRYFVTYERYGNYYHYRKQKIPKNSNRSVLITQQYSKNIIIGHNIYKCKGNVYISQIYVCDGNDDCPDNSKLDEVGCNCNHTEYYSSKCKYITTNNNLRKHCSSFYYSTVKGDCKMIGITFTEFSDKKTKTKLK